MSDKAFYWCAAFERTLNGVSLLKEDAEQDNKRAAITHLARAYRLLIDRDRIKEG